MTLDEKLAAILAAVQTDPGGRGLARDPHDNLFTATAGDFAAACRSIADYDQPGPHGPLRPELLVVTGFHIPTADPPAFETDGPLGAAFLARALIPLDCSFILMIDRDAQPLFRAAGILHLGHDWATAHVPAAALSDHHLLTDPSGLRNFPAFSHVIGLERVGPGADGRCRNMRGRDITDHTAPADRLFRLIPRLDPRAASLTPEHHRPAVTIGIGDGGNEIGMGKIHPDTVAKNIPNGGLVHCRVPTDHLIVAGVSNWGAYALAAGVYVLRGQKPPPDLFDPDREREILEVMVREGPLVDGVTGKQTATVDGLTWDEYAKPLVRIREILAS
jgi:hypothetical protein